MCHSTETRIDTGPSLDHLPKKANIAIAIILNDNANVPRFWSHRSEPLPVDNIKGVGVRAF
jgi:hypothetical protein